MHPGKLTKEALIAERTFATDKFSEIYTPFLNHAKAAAATGAELAGNEELDFGQLLMDGGSDSPTVLRKVNSEEATALRTHWASLVNLNAQLTESMRSIDCERYGYLNIDEVEKRLGKETYVEEFCVSRNKVCEISVSRALVRPYADPKSRVAAIQKSKGVVDELGGQLSIQLAALVKSATGKLF